jgi:hypothetical protein
MNMYNVQKDWDLSLFIYHYSNAATEYLRIYFIFDLMTVSKKSSNMWPTQFHCTCNEILGPEAPCYWICILHNGVSQTKRGHNLSSTPAMRLILCLHKHKFLLPTVKLSGISFHAHIFKLLMKTFKKKLLKKFCSHKNIDGINRKKTIHK